MTKPFAPTHGYFRHYQRYGGWGIGRDASPEDDVAFVAVNRAPGRPIWQSRCDAMLMAGGPEMLDTLVRAHNCLNNIPGAHDPATIARKVQGSIRGGLVKVIGDSERLTSTGIILPSGVIYEEGPEVFDRGK